VYEGDDPTLQKLYRNLNQLPRLAYLLQALTAAVGEVKGMLNERDYQRRLASMRLEGTQYIEVGGCARIIGDQEDRRCDYFRARKLVVSNIGNSIACWREAREAAGAICQRLGQLDDHEQWDEQTWARQFDDQQAIADFEDCAMRVRTFTDNLGKALKIGGEADPTFGEGERAFLTLFEFWRNHMKNPGYFKIRSEIPLDAQVLDLPDVHPDLLPSVGIESGQTLVRIVADIMAKKALHEGDVADLDILYRRHLDNPRAPVLLGPAEIRALPGLVKRVKSYNTYWAEVESPLRAALEDAIQSAGDIDPPPVKEIAQSNCLGAYLVIKMVTEFKELLRELVVATSAGPFVVAAMNSARSWRQVELILSSRSPDLEKIYQQVTADAESDRIVNADA
jgi:hypothetical protein